MKLRNLLLFGSMAVLGVAFTSCSKDIAFDNEGYMAQQENEYEQNFIAKYGAVNPNKSWDMASMQPKYSLTAEGSATRAFTRGIPYTQTTATGFVIEGTVLDYMFDKMPKGKNNSGKGNPFYTTVPLNSFTIVPIFQGTASKYWELWMNVAKDGVEEDIKIWAKGEDLGYRTVAGGTVTSAGTGNNGVAQTAVEVVAPAITFSGLPQGATLYFYLKSWESYSAFTSDTQKTQYTMYTSLNKKMLSLKNCPKPTNVPEGNNVNIIGCEDAGDNDYEDLVFMVYGIPAIKEPTEVFETITKRYMLEDLGSKDDFDFNDIVVDVSQQTKTIFTYEIDEHQIKHLISTDGPYVVKQWAEVRAAGGTLDFTISIGTTTTTTWTKSVSLPPVEQMRNTGWNGASIDYNAVLSSFDIKNNDWNPSSNNISVSVVGRGMNEGVQVIKFPKTGEIPMIIAVDPELNWMVERQSVPSSWIQD